MTPDQEHNLMGTDGDPRWDSPEGRVLLNQMAGLPDDDPFPAPDRGPGKTEVVRASRMNERSMQNRLYADLISRKHRFIVPSTTVLGWESDLVSVTGAGFICEYEIKISRSDFKADLKKSRHRRLSQDATRPYYRGPAYFYYAVPRDMVRIDEVPDYAGLIFVYPMMQIIKKAPRLNKNKISQMQVAWLQRSIMARFWKERLKNGTDV